MTRPAALDARSEQMLELLSHGASARVIAKKLGYSEGTMRVYLHNLYRLIGVRNKTEAVIWHLNRARPAEPPEARAVAPAATAAAVHGGTVLGEMALADGLHAALGVMGSFLGPYGHLWEAGLRLKGVAIDEKMVAQRAQSRLLWRALLKADFAYAKSLVDEGLAERLVCASPADGVLLACLLAIGGYSGAAERMTAVLGDRRRMGTASARELALLKALGAALDAKDVAGMNALYEMASQGSRVPLLKQVAMVGLFYAYRARRDLDRAAATANALWSEAEAARTELDAMGVRPLAREAAVPSPVKSAPREVAAAREKVAVAR